MVYQSQFIARFGTTERSKYPVKTLREIAVSSGEYGANTPATKFNPEIGRYIRITDIDDSGNLNNDMVSPEVAEDKYLLQNGDLLFARTGATVGKTYLHKEGKALYAGYLIKYRFLDIVLPDFVFAYTHSQEYYKWVELTQKVGAQPNISAKQYDGLRIIVPPFEEQKSFVVLMNQADKSKFDGFKSQFIEMFGDPINNSKHWDLIPLASLGRLERGVSKARPRNAPDLLGGPYPLVQTGEVANCETYITSYNSTYSEKGLAQSKMWPAGTLCITIAANIAKTGILTFDACFPDSVVGFIPNDSVDLIFVHHWFRAVQQHLEELAPSTAQKNMNLAVLSSLTVISPPLLEQQLFSSIVNQADKSKYLN